MPFRLPAVGSALALLSESCAWPLAVTSELRSFHRASPLSTCCVWMGRCCFGVRVPALPCEALVPQPCVHHSRGGALLRRAFRPASARCHWRRVPWPLLVGGVPWLTVLHHDVLRLLQPSLHVLTRCRVVSGHHSTNSALSCRVVAGPGVAPASTSRQLTLLTHLETRLEALFVDTPCQLISIFASRVSCLIDILIATSHR